MATVATNPASPSPFAPVPRQLTAADLAAMPDHLPSGPVNFELHQGRLVLMSPTGRRHSNVQARIVKELVSQGEERGHGEAGSEAGVILSKRPDTVVGPDALFVAKRSMPIKESPEGYLETIPELVAEIRSKNDTNAELNTKVTDYLKAGVQLVWVVEPETKTVVEHRPGISPKTLNTSDSLQCDDIIPGFRVQLAELFRE